MDELTTEEIPATKSSDMLALIVSGDGLTPTFSRALAREFRRAGVHSAIVPSMRYFWRRRSPAMFAKHLEKRLQRHLDKSIDGKVILVGYSFGGAVLPFAIRRLPDNQKKAIALVALAAPGRRADFEFKFRGWLNLSSAAARDAEAEIDRMIEEGAPTLLVYGDRDFARAKPSKPGADILMLPSGHDLRGDCPTIVAEILRRIT